MNSSSTLKLFKTGSYTYLYIYFKLKKGYLRIPTGKKYVEGMHRKDLLYNSKMSGHRFLNQQILNLKNKVDQYISYKLQYSRPSVDQQECKEYIKTGVIGSDTNEIHKQPRNRTFFDYYHEFYQFKNTELQNKPSLKDYKSLENALQDYQDQNKKLTFEIINDVDFFNRFRNFLYAKHPDDAKTSGELNANTVQKRIGSLKTFMRYVQDKKYFRFEDALYRYRIKKFQTDFVTLNRDEIRQLENLKIENNNWQTILDVFIMNCFMSLRYSDLKTLNKGEFKKDEDGDVYYTKKNEKTNVVIEIPILPTAKRILEKYNYDPPVYTNQYFNRELRKILEHYNMFNETVKKSEIRNGETVTKKHCKRDLISSHTCRRSFITNAFNSNEVSISAIQASTGHTQLSTLSKYQKRNMNKHQLSAID